LAAFSELDTQFDLVGGGGVQAEGDGAVGVDLG
jgi:hypothetical protein